MGKTGGGRGTNQYAVKGRSIAQDGTDSGAASQQAASFDLAVDQTVVEEDSGHFRAKRGLNYTMWYDTPEEALKVMENHMGPSSVGNVQYDDKGYEQRERAAKQVGDVLGKPVYDDGGGAYVRLTEREMANDVIAFLPDPNDYSGKDAANWRWQDDETGDMKVSGLTIDSPAEDVAAWISETAPKA